MSRGRRALVVVALVAGAACKEVVIELDPLYQNRNELCADTSCATLPRCADGGSSCLACSCCACPEGGTLCDPDHYNVVWRCQSVDEPCDTGSSCQATTDGVACLNGTIDCSQVNPYDLVLICGQTEALCAQCGSCLTCDSMGGSQTCDDFRPSGSADNLLVCDGTSTCMQLTPCPTTEHCLAGAESGVTGCSGSVTCRDVGCTGFAVCGQPASVCGDCGCCDVSVTHPPDTCGAKSDNTGSARYVFNTTSLCYDEIDCSEREICAFDSYDRPICVSY